MVLKRFEKIFGRVLLLLSLLFLGGCFKTSQIIVFNEDGSVSGEIMVSMTKDAALELAEQYGGESVDVFMSADTVKRADRNLPEGAVAEYIDTADTVGVRVSFTNLNVSEVSEVMKQFNRSSELRIEFVGDSVTVEMRNSRPVNDMSPQIDEAEGLEMSISYTFPGEVVSAPDYTIIDGNTVKFSTDDISPDKILAHDKIIGSMIPTPEGLPMNVSLAALFMIVASFTGVLMFITWDNINHRGVNSIRLSKTFAHGYEKHEYDSGDLRQFEKDLITEVPTENIESEFFLDDEPLPDLLD